MSSEEQQSIETEKVTFKRRKKHGNIRNLERNSEDSSEKDNNKKSEQHDDDDEESINWSALDGYRELKRLKKRPQNGINVLDLMSESKKVVETKTEKREGGLTDAKTLASELDLGNTFSLETNRRDEDAELMKYVEEELAKRRPKSAEEVGNSGNTLSGKSNLSDDLLIRVIPEHLLKISIETKAKNEEMLSSQMLSGIPEVDLGIEERIRNIEKTEAARNKLLQQRLQQQRDRANSSKGIEKDVSLVPNNLASCFTRNNNIVQQAANASNHRFSMNSMPIENKDLMEHFGNKQQMHKQPPKQTYEIEPVVVLGLEPRLASLAKPMDKDKRMPGKDKPMDDYIFEKFKKHIRKH